MKSKQGARLVLLVALVAMGGTFWWMFSPYQQGASEPAVSTTGPFRPSLSGRPSVTTSQIPAATGELSSSIGAWRRADPAQYDELPVLRDDIEGAALVSLSRDHIIGVQVGESLEIIIPQLDNTLTIVIEKVRLHASGSRSLYGHWNGDRRYGLVLTVGARSTFATIGTPAGIFNLRGNADLAWIVPAREFQRHINPDVPDYVVAALERPAQ